MTGLLSALFALAAMQPPAPAAAPTLSPGMGDPPCTPAEARLDGPLADWNRAPAAAAGVAAVPGRPVRVALDPVARVGFAQPPERAPAPDSRAAALAVEIAEPGRYRIALSGPAWIDVVAGPRRLASAAHGHGPRCSGIRKIVDYDLPAGRHLIQLSGSQARDVVLMVARGESGAR